MGVNYRKYLDRDPDPEVNREQDRNFQLLIDLIGDFFQQDPTYANASDDEKMFMWEQKIIGDKGAAAIARDAALRRYPTERVGRDVIQKNPGRFTRKMMGLDQTLQLLRELREKQ